MKKMKSENSNKESKSEKTVSKKSLKKKYKLALKRKNRRKRRQKSNWKQKNLKKMADKELLEQFNNFKMNTEYSENYNELPTEVASWEKEEQLIYWKSRAIAFEIENTVLLNQLRDIYASTLEQFINESNGNTVEPKSSSAWESNHVKPSTSKQPSEPKEEIHFKIPEGKNRLTEMEKIYGKSAQTIMGMETAIQLNYERLCDETSKITHWPNIPL